METPRIIVLYIVAMCLLVSCGGGGGGTVEDPPEKPSSIIQSKLEEADDQFIDNAESLTRTIVAISESVLQLGYLADLITRALPSDLEAQFCRNSEEAVFSRDSVAHSDTYTDGDVLGLQFLNCHLNQFGDSFTGSIRLTVDDYDIGQVGLSVTFSDLIVEHSDVHSNKVKKLEMNGSFNVRIVHTPDQDAIAIDSAQVRFLEESVRRYEVSDWEVVRTIDHQKGEYSISSSGQFFDADNVKEYSISQDSPWVGDVLAVPHEGSMFVANDQSSIMYLSVNPETVGASIHTFLKNRRFGLRWDDHLKGTYWAGHNSFGRPPSQPEPEAAMFYGVPPIYFIRGLYQDEPVRLLFSGGLQSAELLGVFDDSDVSFLCHGSIATFHPGHVEVSGNMVLVHSTDPLPSGWICNTGDVLPKDNGESRKISVHGGDIPITTRALAKIEPSSYFYDDNDKTTLKATGSFVDDEIVSVQWLDPEGKGVLFENPFDFQTGVTLPATGDYTVRVALKSASGISAYDSIRIFSLNKSKTMLAINSEIGDFIGSGDQWLYHEADGDFSFTYQPDKPVQLMFEFNGETWWRLSLAVADGVEFGPGRYKATRNFTQATNGDDGLFSGNKPKGFGALDFSGDGRGCNALDAEFEILEFSVNENNEVVRLALDFWQRCQLERPHTRVVLRFNSDYPINN